MRIKITYNDTDELFKLGVHDSFAFFRDLRLRLHLR